MKVKELREKLDLVSGDCEVLIIDNRYEATFIENAGLDCYFDDLTENRETPFCIRGY